MSLEKRIWGSPKKKKKLDKGNGADGQPGNPLGLTYSKCEDCQVCGLVKRPDGSKKKHHGSKCHWCHIRIQSFARKYFSGVVALNKFSKLQLEHVKVESTALRKKDL